MARWVIPVATVAVLALAAGVGAWVWVATSDADCDREALAETIRAGIAQAGRDGLNEFTPERPSECSEEDLTVAMHTVTHEWHVMPGGSLMRGMSHEGE